MTNPLEKLFKACQDKKHPPVHLWNPPHCGEIGLKIDMKGDWIYQNSPIQRKPMVKLFSTILKREENGDHVLVTPVEKIRIEVEDVPFLAVELSIEETDGQKEVYVRTNLDEVIKIDAEHPLTFKIDPENQGVKPYIDVRNGLLARFSRTVTYELMDRMEENTIDDEKHLGLWSAGQFFPLMKTSEIG